MSTNLLFLIEGGKPLELVKQHIAEVIRVKREAAELLTELGVTKWCPDTLHGQLVAVVFDGNPHPDFKKPKRNGVSYPKRGTEWEQRFAALKGYEMPTTVIHGTLGVPVSIKYSKDGGEGWSWIGMPLRECGWLYLSADGPYAMWTPNVPAEVAEREKNGYTVAEPAKSWRPAIEGARPVEPEEWDILVAQHNLAEKQQRIKDAGAPPAETAASTATEPATAEELAHGA